MRKLVLTVVAVALAFSRAGAQEHGSKIASTPQWERLKTLVGEWGGYVAEGEKKFPSHVSVRLTGDGSALMHWMDAGTPHEMITMFHMDKDDLLATHYCAAHNQPRMRALPSGKPDRIAFEFVDGTNIRPGDTFMRRLAITFVDADHHDEEWGADVSGQVHTAVFHFTRAKAAAKP